MHNIKVNPNFQKFSHPHIKPSQVGYIYDCREYIQYRYELICKTIYHSNNSSFLSNRSLGMFTGYVNEVFPTIAPQH